MGGERVNVWMDADSVSFHTLVYPLVFMDCENFSVYPNLDQPRLCLFPNLARVIGGFETR